VTYQSTSKNLQIKEFEQQSSAVYEKILRKQESLRETILKNLRTKNVLINKSKAYNILLLCLGKKEAESSYEYITKVCNQKNNNIEDKIHLRKYCT
jgi:hypothetical protein